MRNTVSCIVPNNKKINTPGIQNGGNYDQIRKYSFYVLWVYVPHLQNQMTKFLNTEKDSSMENVP